MVQEHDRVTTLLPGAQEPLLEAVLEAQPKTVIVIIGGGSLSVAAARNCTQCAVLYAYCTSNSYSPSHHPLGVVALSSV